MSFICRALFPDRGFGGILSNAAKGSSIGQLIVVCFFVFMKRPRYDIVH